MTISEYLKNPYGKGSAFSSSTKQKDDLDAQFKGLSEKILSKIYMYRDFIIYHVVIPSTSKTTVNYDVIIEVGMKDIQEGAATLEDAPFKVFSNCPSFIFTYANVFRANNMLCEWLLPKYNPEVRTKAPTVRNQYGIIGLERSVYLALKHLHSSGKTKFGIYQSTSKKVSGRTEIINSVRSQQQIMNNVHEKVPPDKENAVISNQDPVFGRKEIAPKKSNDTEEKTKKTQFTKSVKTLKEVKKAKTTRSTKRI